MIKSMTAFASSEAEIDTLTVNCELRSVNHRYCDVTVKLPDRLRFSEADIRSSITAKLKRGKIECALSYKKHAQNGLHLYVNEEAVKSVMQATAQIEEHMHTQQSFTAMDVLNFPGIQQEPESNKQLLIQGVHDLVNETLDKLVASREREGIQLKAMIQERCIKIQALVESASQRMPEVLVQMKSKIKARLTELVADPDFDRLEQEMVYLAQKLDVAEELDRLQTHTQEVLHILDKEEAVGRRLDFLMQEMNREANTLGSKSADKQMTQISIDLKVLIEQMREQIQNIE